MIGTEEQRPWGSWRILDADDDCVLKKITVKAGHMLSLQSHGYRSEEWTPTETGLIAYVEFPDAGPDSGPYAVIMQKDERYLIPERAKHRLINPTSKDLSLFEVIKGKYDENDITRYHDSYGRK